MVDSSIVVLSVSMDPAMMNVMVSELVKLKATEDGCSNCSDAISADDLPDISQNELMQLQDQMRKVPASFSGHSCCHRRLPMKVIGATCFGSELSP